MQLAREFRAIEMPTFLKYLKVNINDDIIHYIGYRFSV